MEQNKEGHSRTQDVFVIARGPLFYFLIALAVFFFSVEPNIIDPLQAIKKNTEAIKESATIETFWVQRQREAEEHLPPVCVSCHIKVGPSARQQFGLNSLILPISALSETEFIEYTRGVRPGVNTVMPDFPPEVISDAELRRIYRQSRYPILE